MIQNLVLVGAPILLAIWLAGVPALWKGRSKITLWAAGSGVLLGIVCAFSGLAGPRQANFWTGNAGAGDGFGLIGLFVMGGILAGISLAIFFVTAVIASIRVKQTEQEVPE